MPRFRTEEGRETEGKRENRWPHISCHGRGGRLTDQRNLYCRDYGGQGGRSRQLISQA